VIFTETRLPGVTIVDLDLKTDDRGFFARSFCAREFAERGLCASFPQCNVSYNKVRGTLRGMHYNRPPHEEAKLVRCQTGSIFDVVVDLRQNSRTLGQWFGLELSQHNRRALYIPRGLAHGFLTLTPDSEIFYQMSDFYAEGAGLGLRYDDPGVGIDWPETPTTVSPRDRNYPDWHPEGEDA
jgi:dTDP-4-dehydrorhamnose 3,5-epimerase